MNFIHLLFRIPSWFGNIGGQEVRLSGPVALATTIAIGVIFLVLLSILAGFLHSIQTLVVLVLIVVSALWLARNGGISGLIERIRSFK